MATRRPYPALLHAAGFDDIGERDLTQEYLATTRAWLENTEPLCDEVAAIDGAETVAQRLIDLATSADAIERGWLLRHLYWARRP